MQNSHLLIINLRITVTSYNHPQCNLSKWRMALRFSVTAKRIGTSERYKHEYLSVQYASRLHMRHHFHSQHYDAEMRFQNYPLGKAFSKRSGQKRCLSVGRRPKQRKKDAFSNENGQGLKWTIEIKFNQEIIKGFSCWTLNACFESHWCCV